MLNVSEAVNKYLFESSAQHGRNLVWARDVLNFVEEVGLGDGRERDLDTGRAEQGKAFIPWSVGGAEAHRSSVDVGLRDEHDSTKCTGFCVFFTPCVQRGVGAVCNKMSHIGCVGSSAETSLYSQSSTMNGWWNRLEGCLPFPSLGSIWFPKGRMHLREVISDRGHWAPSARLFWFMFWFLTVVGFVGNWN